MRKCEKKQSAEEYLKNALGGNMNISTLKLKFWYEVMQEYAEAYSKKKMFGLFKHYTKKYEMTFTDKFIEDMINEYLNPKS